MPQASSDRNYAAVTRFRRPYSATPPVWLDDEQWRKDNQNFLSEHDDLLDIQKFESVVAPLLEEGELDADAIVVTPSGNSSAAANHAAERRRREERWTDNGLDQLLPQAHDAGNNATNRNNSASRSAGASSTTNGSGTAS